MFPDNGEKSIDKFINNDDIDSRYKIIKMLEIEYDYIEKQQMAMFYSNEEMLKYDPNDIDLIDARAENIKLIEKNIIRMHKIKSDILELDRDHYIINKNIFSFETKLNLFSNNFDNVEINTDNINIIHEINL
jgi:hypothetical protein